jgi:hypothetical protein
LTPAHRHRQSTRKGGTERPHFRSILSFVYRNRFAVASQIQRRFASVLRSDRTTRRHLEEMEALGLLGVAPARGVGPLFPKVFYVTGRGVKKIQETLATKGKSWKPSRVDRSGRHTKEGYTTEQVIHEILLTEFLLAVWQTIDGRPDLELKSIERRSVAKHRSFQFSVGKNRVHLKPDAMFLFAQNGGGMVCCFVEMDLGTMNRKQIKAKYRRYQAWSESTAGQAFLLDLYRRHGATDPRPTFRLLMVARDRVGTDDDKRLLDLFRPIVSLPAALQDRVWLTTVSSLRQYQRDPLPLAAPIWLRARDLRRQISDPKDTQAVRDLFRSHMTGDRTLHELFPKPAEVATA